MQKNLCVAVVDLRKAFCIPEDGKVLAKYFSLLLSWTLWASAASLRCWRSPPTEETEPHLPSYSSDQTDADFFSRNFLGFISNNRSRLFFWKFHSHLACFLLHIDQSNLHTPLFKVELGSQNPHLPVIIHKRTHKIKRFTKLRPILVHLVKVIWAKNGGSGTPFNSNFPQHNRKFCESLSFCEFFYG